MSDSAAVVCVYCQVRSSCPWGVGVGEGLATGMEQGKAGPAAAPETSVASAVKAPLSLLNIDSPVILHAVLGVRFPVFLRLNIL